MNNKSVFSQKSKLDIIYNSKVVRAENQVYLQYSEFWDGDNNYGSSKAYTVLKHPWPIQS